SELVREADIADAESTSSVTTYSRTSSLLQKPVSTCRSELVREDDIAGAESASNLTAFGPARSCKKRGITSSWSWYEIIRSTKHKDTR
ncbi:hypothetical protein GIW03_22710, partial [Pseudomonas syringae]|nr:hypothetical protein [Pseudomonas syringae]